MSEQCEDCGQKVLASDTVCWHCGHELAARPQLTLPEAKVANAAPAAEDDRPDYDLRALAFYGVVTMVIILALLLVMQSLSQRPLLVRSAGLSFASDWVSLTDSELSYTVALPPDWQWLDVGHRRQQATLDDLISRQGFIGRALAPLSDLTPALEILAVGLGTPSFQETEPVPFLVIGRGADIAGLTPEQALAWLNEQALPVTEAEVDTRLPLQHQARFDLIDERFSYQCHHLFVAGQQSDSYLVAACSPQDQFGVAARELGEILDSFQLLQH